MWKSAEANLYSEYVTAFVCHARENEQFSGTHHQLLQILQSLEQEQQTRTRACG